MVKLQLYRKIQKCITHLLKDGYNMAIMRKTACVVLNPILVGFCWACIRCPDDIVLEHDTCGNRRPSRVTSAPTRRQ